MYKFLDQQDNYRSQVAESIGDIDQKAYVTRYFISCQHPFKIKTVIGYIAEIKSCGSSDDPGDRGDQVEMESHRCTGGQDESADDNDVIQLKSLIVIPDEKKSADDGQDKDGDDGAGAGKDVG